MNSNSIFDNELCFLCVEESGYFMAKFGTVALTRGFAQRGREGPWRKHGVKAMALCPWFANTQLVRKTTTVGELGMRIISLLRLYWTT